MNNHKVEMGQRIRAARKAKGWNAARLAQEAGVAPNTLSNIERGLGYQDGNLGKVLTVLPEARLALADSGPDYPADVELARDWLGAHLVALSPEDRRGAVHSMMRHLIERSEARQSQTAG